MIAAIVKESLKWGVLTRYGDTSLVKSSINLGTLEGNPARAAADILLRGTNQPELDEFNRLYTSELSGKVIAENAVFDSSKNFEIGRMAKLILEK